MAGKKKLQKSIAKMHESFNDAVQAVVTHTPELMPDLWAETLDMYDGNTAQAAEFLLRESFLYGGKSPIEWALQSTANKDQVIENVNRIKYGVYI